MSIDELGKSEISSNPSSWVMMFVATFSNPFRQLEGALRVFQTRKMPRSSEGRNATPSGGDAISDIGVFPPEGLLAVISAIMGCVGSCCIRHSFDIKIMAG